jgi:hypothetical protein
VNILINGKKADITLDTEKTLGDVLAGLETWISSTGGRLQTVSVDGKAQDEAALAASFGRDVGDIQTLAIEATSYRELASQALASLRETCACFEAAAFAERTEIVDAWHKSAAARFLQAEPSGVFELAACAFRGEGLAVQDLARAIDERLRELAAPAVELAACAQAVETASTQMEELPLNIQTGKDAEAALAIQLFSSVCEKLFRLFVIFQSEGATPNFSVEELNATLVELSVAYENNDTVLVGDIAEYDLAPRLRAFYAALDGATPVFLK